MRFNDARLIKRNQTKGPLDFIIYFYHNGIAYPDDVWYDFGGVILAWWLLAATQIVKGNTTATFSFMEGPYALHISSGLTERDLIVKPHGLDEEWTVTREELAQELMEKAEEVINKLNALKIGDSDRSGIEHAMNQLKMAVRLHGNAPER